MNGPAKILIVEDEPMVADVVGRYLTRDGFEVEKAADGNHRNHERVTVSQRAMEGFP